MKKLRECGAASAESRQITHLLLHCCCSEIREMAWLCIEGKCKERSASTNH
jgi:hypothetical protein